MVLWLQYRQKMSHLIMEKAQMQIDWDQLFEEHKYTRNVWALTASSNNPKLPAECFDKIGLKQSLVVRISENHCSTCVDQLLFQVKKHLESIGHQQIIVLYSGQTPAFVKQKHRTHLLDPVRFIEITDSIPLCSMDQFNLPYCFLTQGGFISNTFLPYPANDNFTSTYLNNIALILNN
jgi:hypothetical protein